MKTLQLVPRRLFLRLIAFTWLVATVLATFAATAKAEESRLDVVLKRGKVIVATFSTAPPLCFTDDKGQLVGFDIDIAKLIAKGLLGDEKKIEFVTVDSAGRWPAVLSGKADFGIAATTVYPDRAARVAFTQPYMDSGISLLVRKDANVNTLGDLNNAKYTLANLSNPQMADRAKRYLPNMKVLTFDTASAMFLAVKSGQATALQMDTPVADWYAAQHGDLKVLPELLSAVQNNAIFLKPGDFAWWRYLDTVVQELRYGSRYEEYAAVFKKWFGKNPPPQRFYVREHKG